MKTRARQERCDKEAREAIKMAVPEGREERLPMMAIVILFLTHLVIFVPWSDQIKVWIISAGFLGAFFQEASSWMIRYWHPSFAYLKIISFISLQSVIAISLLALGAYLWRWGQPKRKRSR